MVWGRVPYQYDKLLEAWEAEEYQLISPKIEIKTDLKEFGEENEVS